MKEQNYKNHIFYYPPHHYFFYSAIITAFAVCGFGIYKYEDQRLLWSIITGLIVLIVWLALMVRQHYALGNQNRTVRLEMRLRYYILTGKRFEDIERQLGFKKIAALRFVSDSELLPLIDKAIKEKLSPDEIKRSIVTWLADDMRV